MSRARTPTTYRAATAPPGQQHDIHRCEHCQKHYPLAYGFNRSYCRRRCKYRSLADRLLDHVKHDHQHCFSCFRKLKEIEPPTLTKKSAELGKSVPDCAIGEQVFYDFTRHDLRNTYDMRNAPDNRQYASTALAGRMTCSCPSNHHMTVHELPADAEWTRREAIKHTQRLEAALDDLADRGVHSTDFDADTLFGFVRMAKTRDSVAHRDDRDILRDGLSLAIQEAR